MGGKLCAYWGGGLKRTISEKQDNASRYMLTIVPTHLNKKSILAQLSFIHNSMSFMMKNHLLPAPPLPCHNHLIGALCDKTQERLLPHLELVSLLLGQILYESGDTVRHVYFPVDAIVSLLYVMENGTSAEISVIGNDGMVGIALFMGGESTLSHTVVQSAGYAYRLSGQHIKTEFNRHGETMVLLLRYIQALITQMAQTAACNRHHSIDQQLCRWLLLSLDRLSDNHLAMTQELIASMLGVRREGVTEAAGKLQEIGVIEYSRGHITVLDRPRLEQLCCECYAVVKKETDRLLGHHEPPIAAHV